MELIKNIFFNTDKLVQNTIVKISYTGKFYEDNSDEVYIHYGFGENWDNLSEIKMDKTELGFQCELKLLENSTFNFCFKNEKNEWDNNDNNNYVFELEAPCLELIATQSEYSFAKPNRLRKTYIWGKKVKIALYKALRYLPKLMSGNYKRKVEE